MRHALALAGMVVLAAAAAAGEDPRWGEAPTGLVVDSSEVDLGRVAAGSQATATFHLRNPGEKDVRILAARPS